MSFTHDSLAYLHQLLYLRVGGEEGLEGLRVGHQILHHRTLHHLTKQLRIAHQLLGQLKADR